MKTVCKKLFLMALVVMMLVAVAPAAFAADPFDDHPCFANHPDSVEILNDTRTCTAAGDVQYWCYECENGSTVVGAPALGHDWNTTGTVTTEPTCTEKGKTTYDCNRCDATDVREDINPLGHIWEEDAYVAGKEPTCTKTGVMAYTCERDPAHTKQEEVPSLGGHRYGTDGKCTVCGESQSGTANDTYTLTFYYLDKDGKTTTTTSVIHMNDTIPFPSVPLVSSKAFLHKWKGSNETIYNEGIKWTGGSMPTTFTAQYESDTTDDGLVSLEVWANYYVEGEYHHREKLYTKSFDKSSTRNSMFTWLYSNEGINQTSDAVFGGGANSTYQWATKIYYNYYDNAAVTSANMKDDGNKAVYIKVTSKKDMEASVMLYVHLKQTETVDRVIPMPGYTAGDSVPHSAVKAAVKTKYSGSNMTVSNLYTEDDWDRLMDGQNSSGAYSVQVEDNGTTKIHVIVKNATSKSSATKDPTNPATGDNIMIVVGTMTVAAAGLAAVAVLKKRKMI